MHWQGVIPGVTPKFSNFYLAVCRLHELIRERVWIITFFRHFYVSFRSRDLVRLFNECMKSCLGIVVPRNLRPACPVQGITFNKLNEQRAGKSALLPTFQLHSSCIFYVGVPKSGKWVFRHFISRFQVHLNVYVSRWKAMVMNSSVSHAIAVV